MARYAPTSIFFDDAPPGHQPAPQQQHRAGLPFATADVPTDAYPAAEDFHLIDRKHVAVTGKAGVVGYEAAVYAANRAANKATMDESKARNNGGGRGPFATHDVDASVAYARDFHKQPEQRALPDKIGSAATFDAEAYRSQLARNQELHEQTRSKRYGSGGGGVCPFATDDSAELRQPWHRADYQPKAAAKAMTDKVGAAKSFDASVYSAARATNREAQATSAARHYSGGGDILAFPGGAAQ